MPKLDKLIDLEQLQIVSKNKQKQIENLKEKKVDKEEGKGLSSNDFTDSYKTQVEANTANRHTHSNKSILDATTASYTTAEKTKLSGIESGAEVNVQSDWEESNNSKDEFIKNKPEFERVDDRLIPILPYIDPDKEYDFIDHINEPTYRFTAPANSKLLMLQSIAGNSVKYSPSVASDNTASHIKTLPSTVYDMDVSKVEGVGYKVNQLVVNGNFTDTIGWASNACSKDANDNILTMTSSSVTSACGVYRSMSVDTTHKFLVSFDARSSDITSDITSNKMTPSANFGALTQNWKTYSGIYNTLNDNSLTLYTYSPSVGITWQLRNVMVFDLTADFGSGNEPSTVSDCYTAYLSRGINIYEYTPQQSSIKNNAFTGVKVEGTNKYNKDIIILDLGGINAQGEDASLNTRMRMSQNSKIFLKAGTYILNFDNLDYYGWFAYRSANDTTSVEISSWINKGNTFTLTNYYYVRFAFKYSDERVITSVNELTNVMLNYGSTAMTYVPYTSQTIPIDLTQIKDSNNVSLFPSGKMMGNSNVADFITPYNQESRWNELDLSTPNWQYWGANNCWLYEITSIIKYDTLNYLCDKYQLVDSYTNMPNNSYHLRYYDYHAYIYIKTDGTQVTRPSGILQCERATYLTSTTDLTSLAGIQGQSLGTITLNNTGNVDMPNLISYNAIIKHALATAVKYESFNVLDNSTFVKGRVDNGNIGYASDTTSLTTTTNSITFTTNTGYRGVASGLIDVIPNERYDIIYTENTDGSFYVDGYDDESNWISRITLTSITYGSHYKFTVPSNVAKVRLSIQKTGDGTTTFSNVCVFIYGDGSITTYKPHKPTYTRALTNNEAKYSWGITTGVRNVRTYCDDEGNAVNEGSLVVGNNDLGSDNWTYDSGNLLFLTSLDTLRGYPFISTIYDFAGDISVSSVLNMEGITRNNTLFLKNTLFNNATIFKTASDGVPLFYEKNTTDTETLDDFDFFFDCEEGDTFTIIGCELLQCYATYSFVVEHVE